VDEARGWTKDSRQLSASSYQFEEEGLQGKSFLWLIADR
jgi:hypothetical protein